jgi:proline iminopeptidase
MPDQTPSFRSSLVDIGDATLEVLEAGEGPITFACTHPYANASGAHPGGALSDALAAAGRTLYVAPRATGRSSPEARPECLGMHQTVDDLEAVRRALGIERWVVAGTSTGGMTALEYGLRYPEASAGLVCIGGAASWRFLEDPACIYNPEHPQAWREEQAREALDGSAEASRAWLRTVIDLSLQRKELLDRLVERADISGPRLAAIRDELIGVWDRSDDLAGIAVPVLVGVGRHDTQCPIAASELIAARVPDATLVVFERSGHFPFEEEPERFREAVLAYAASLAPGAVM